MNKPCIMPPFEQRAFAVLDRAFNGIHHVDSLNETALSWTCVYRGGLSTFDFDNLTRLVLGAHEYCVRVEIMPLGKRGLKIEISERKGREGRFYESHPTIETAIQRFKSN